MTLPEADGRPVIDRTNFLFYDLFLLGLFTDRRKEVLLYLQQEDRYGERKGGNRFSSSFIEAKILAES